MSALNIIQISIEIWGCIISLIISLFTASEVKKKKSGNILWKMLLVNVLTLASDSLAYVYRGDISAIGITVTRISSFLLLLLEYILLLLFSHYVQSVQEEQGLVYRRRRLAVIYVLLGILPAAAMLLQLAGYGSSLLNIALTCAIIIGYLQYYFGRIKADADLLVEEAKDETRQVMEKYEQLKKQTTEAEQCEK